MTRVFGISGSLFRRWVAAATVVTVVNALTTAVFAQAAAPELSIQGDHFMVKYGSSAAQPKFLLFVSYFGAFRRAGSERNGMTASEKALLLAEIRNDFITIRNLGFQGVRIFPNWIWSWDSGYDQCDATDPNTMMGINVLNEGAFGLMAQILAIAGEEQLIVDLSFNMEQVRTIGDTARLRKHSYRSQFDEIARRGAGLMKHVFFDLENEFNGLVTNENCPKEKFSPSSAYPFPGVSEGPTILDLRNAVKGRDPGRKVTASLAYEITLSDAALATYFAGLDFIAFHDSRSHPNWPAATASSLVSARNLMGYYNIWYPVLFQEPPIAATATFDQMFTAACNARKHGAAGWTFHTEKTFKVAATEDGRAQGILGLSDSENQFLSQGIKRLENECPWIHNP